MAISLIVVDFSSHSCLNKFSSLTRSLHPKYAVFFAGKPVVVHEELFQFATEFLPQIIHSFYVRPTAGILLNCHYPVVTLLVFLVALLTLDHADGSAGQHTAGECWLVHQYQHVHEIAIVSFGLGNEPEVVRKSYSGWQDFLQFEDMLLRIERKFVSAPFRSFDHNSEQITLKSKQSLLGHF
jgi:hypothetical protein